MRGVSRSIRRVAAVLTVSAVLCGHAPIASAKEKESKGENLLKTFIVWIYSGLSVPGG